MKNIYEQAILSMDPNDIDHHETDLYLRVNEQSKKLVNEYDYKNIVETFISNIPPFVLWYDIPFAYIPGWYPENRYPNTEIDKEIANKYFKKTEGTNNE